jgi:16S rRNA (uracil1498-N3)-methyltransferase
VVKIPRLTWAGGLTEGSGEEIWLDAAQARHGGSVLRLKPGDLVEVAGPASLARARVTMAAGGRAPRLGLVFCEAGPNSVQPAGPEPTGPLLGLALISLPRFDWAVEKAAELGAGEIWPLVCDRVKPGLARAASARAARWNRLAEEARKQCGRPRPLVIRPPVTPAVLLASAGRGPAGFFLSPRRPASPPDLAGSPADSVGGFTRSLAPSSAIWVLVGPEGGFTPGEEAAFLAAGLAPRHLGPLTLRAETAALAALALLSEGGRVFSS